MISSDTAGNIETRVAQTRLFACDNKVVGRVDITQTAEGFQLIARQYNPLGNFSENASGLVCEFRVGEALPDKQTALLKANKLCVEGLPDGRMKKSDFSESSNMRF